MIRALRTVFLLTGAGLLASQAMALEPQENATQDDQGTPASRLEKILQQAADSGYVSLKGQEEATPLSQPPEAGAQEEAPLQPEILPPVAQQKPDTPRRAALRLAPTGQEKAQPAPRKCSLSGMFYFDEEFQNITYDDVIELRQKLLDGDADYSSPGGIKLIKAYLSLGLAEEAIAVSDVLPGDQGELLKAMGQVAALENVDQSDRLQELAACTKLALPWNAMAAASDNPAEALRLIGLSTGELFEMPKSLKQLFATQLGILAAEEGNWPLAEELAGIAAVASETPDASLLYLNSLLDSHSGRDDALKAMKQVAMEPSPVQAKALLSLGKYAADRQETPYRDYLTDLELLKVQFKNGRESTTAEIMEIRLLVETSDYSDLVERVLGQFQRGSEDIKIVRDIIAASMQQSFNGDDPERKFSALNGFVDHRSFFEGYQYFVQLRLLAAETALSFELPKLVLVLLEDMEGQATQKDRLIAEASLLRGASETALKLGARHETPEFTDISVRAATQKGDLDKAMALLKKHPETEEILARRAKIAWDAGNWQAAKEAYADLLLSDSTEELVSRHALASYMSGEGGGFYSLEAFETVSAIQQVLDSYADEKEILQEYLDNG